MTDKAIVRRMIAVEHVTIQSAQAFDVVRAKLEVLLPPLEDAIMQHIAQGDASRALHLMEAGPDLSIFSALNHGGLLMTAGLRRKAVQYEIGNPLTASAMTRHDLAAALYAPVRVLLLEYPEGGVAFEYDRPASTFGQFCNAAINIVSQSLDQHLQAVLKEAAA